MAVVSFRWAAATDGLESHTLEAIAAGVFDGKIYGRTLDPVPAAVSEQSTSRSAVSRRFVALSTERRQAFVNRPPGELDLRVVCIDGKTVQGTLHRVGNRHRGARKHVLGLCEGE
ncbi:MAG: hypothetical protein OXT64_04160 [Gammaproteobacteria bacterium]|nr:hypothetical protein [Gammaproteobacteria bacterium]